MSDPSWWFDRRRGGGGGKSSTLPAEVYRADDTKLKREVAIKILPEAFARDEERLKRFEREAQMLASLNHPNIASIYGLEEDDGRLFLVLELVEGPTLAERIQEGPIPLEEALRIARQIADALCEAHEKGIIHRDLKPANVKLTPEGQVKILDFGLAKAFSGDTTEAGASSELSQSPTLSRQATAVGLILGTAVYMSPEQAKGKKVDRRTDVWAFGVVLYEMLTGKRLFDGEDVSETLAAVLRAEPDWSALPGETPSAIRRLLRRALTKDRRERLGDIGDARLEIKETEDAPQAEASAPSKRSMPLLLAGLFLIAITTVLAWSLWRSGSEPGTVTRYTLVLPETDAVSINSGLAWSPDGKLLAYPASRDGVVQLFLRARDRLGPIPLPDTEGAMSPFFSPDGEWVGFFTGDSLKKVAVDGGPSVTLCPTNHRYGATWGPTTPSCSPRGVRPASCAFRRQEGSRHS